MCLGEVFRQTSQEDLNVSVFLVDDGSTDGTADVVKANYPKVQVLIGNGNLFWNRGMHLAFGAALERGFDYYFWLNDDTHLHEGAIRVLINIHQELSANDKGASIIIGSTRDPVSGDFTYGGYLRSRSSPFRLGLRLVAPSEKLNSCDSFCGNCVLIPQQVADKVGNINPVYMHRWGDVDYGLRALEQGIHTWIAPGFLADCETNPVADRWKNPEFQLVDRFRDLNSIKGLGEHDWPAFLKRHGGIFWPIIWVRPYLRIILEALFSFPKTIISRLTGP
jgi:GT2 family glycosyltransferase